MEKIITMENLRSFAYCNDAICKRPIRGLAVAFYGLGGTTMYQEDPQTGIRLAEEGILYVVPYQNPWAWQNQQNVSYTDEILDVLFQAYNLPENLPIVSTGGSMGGLSALVYMVYAKRTPVACVANCPVCDVPFHFTERPDLPRTLYSAFYNYDGTLQEALLSISPLHLVEKMPADAKYYIFHCEEDTKVNKKLHSDRFVEKMQKNHHIQYIPVPDRGHCDLPEDIRAQFRQLMIDSVLSRPVK